MKKYIENFIKYFPLLFLLTSKDFKLKYRRSVLGVFWSTLNPLLIMIVVTSVFSVILKFSLEKIRMPFAVFYITGSLIFNFFSEASSSSMTAITANASLIQKVYVPKYIFILEKCAFSLINLLFSTIAVLVVVFYYVLKGQVVLHATIFLIFVPIFFTFLFSVGVGLILSTLTVFFRDIVHLWGVILTMWVYLTPIVYPIEVLKFSSLDWVIKLNPIYYFVTDLRKVMILGEIITLKSLIIESFSCFFVLILGILLFKKAQDKFILHI